MGQALGPSSRRELYFRFSAGTDDPYSRRQQGIFHVGDDLLDPDRLTAEQREVFDLTRSWFNDYLIAPDLDEPRAIFWFRAGAAGECISIMWGRVTLLRDLGINVAVSRCTNPGLVIYRDELQIAAIPPRDARWRYRAL